MLMTYDLKQYFRWEHVKVLSGKTFIFQHVGDMHSHTQSQKFKKHSNLMNLYRNAQ